MDGMFEYMLQIENEPLPFRCRIVRRDCTNIWHRMSIQNNTDFVRYFSLYQIRGLRINIHMSIEDFPSNNAYCKEYPYGHPESHPDYSGWHIHQWGIKLPAR